MEDTDISKSVMNDTATQLLKKEAKMAKKKGKKKASSKKKAAAKPAKKKSKGKKNESKTDSATRLARAKSAKNRDPNSIGGYINTLIREKKHSDDTILARVLKRFKGASTKKSNISWQRSQLRLAGEKI